MEELGCGPEVPRCSVWKACRVDKNGVIDNENVQGVVDKCVSQMLIFCIHVIFSC